MFFRCPRMLTGIILVLALSFAPLVRGQLHRPTCFAASSNLANPADVEDYMRDCLELANTTSQASTAGDPALWTTVKPRRGYRPWWRKLPHTERLGSCLFVLGPAEIDGSASAVLSMNEITKAMLRAMDKCVVQAPTKLGGMISLDERETVKGALLIISDTQQPMQQISPFGPG